MVRIWNAVLAQAVTVSLAKIGLPMVCVTHEVGFPQSVTERFIFYNPYNERNKAYLSQPFV